MLIPHFLHMGSLWHTFAPSPVGFVSSTVALFVLNFILPTMTHEWGNIQMSPAWIQKWPKLIYAWKGSTLLKPHHVDILYEPSLGSVSPESSFGRSGWLYPTLTGPKLALGVFDGVVYFSFNSAGDRN